MTLKQIGIVAPIVAAALFAASDASARDLTFEERVKAQAAIERVYYAHQTGARRTFAEAVSSGVIEQKVRDYLKQSVLLERRWNTPITDEMLRREMQRMSRSTRMPERLRELYAALGNDAFLIQECLGRPALVQRMSRSFFASDAAIHEGSRRQAEEIRHGLVRGWIDPRAGRADRAEVEMVPMDRPDRGASGVEAGLPPGGAPDPTRMNLPRADYEKWVARIPQRPGEVGEVVEEREAFIVQVLLEARSDARRFASYAVPKTTWDEWWNRSAAQLDEGAVRAVASDRVPVPEPGTESTQVWNPDAYLQSTTTSATPAVADDTWDNGSLGAIPDPRHQHTAVWTGTEMIVWGGFNNGAYLNSGGRYDPATDTWRATSTQNAPTGRGLHTGVWSGSKMVIWGGYNPRKIVYNKCTITKRPQEPECVYEAKIDQVILKTYSPLDDGGLYDPLTDSWTPTAGDNASIPGNELPSARYGHTAVMRDGAMIVWGGYGVIRNDPCGNAVLDYLDTGGVFFPDFNGWFSEPVILSGTGAPEARWAHGAVEAGWTEIDNSTFPPTEVVRSGMVVWGGFGATSYKYTICNGVNQVYERDTDTVGYLATGAFYDLNTNTWSPISGQGGPSARQHPTAVWTGDRMIVWGGLNNATALNSGGRYDPATDTWTATTTTGAPDGRFHHTAVWTGSAMLVWGGFNGGKPVGFQHLNSGATYDPAVDAWTALPTTGAPTGRFNHSAVWTGDRMIVWGGQGPLSSQATLSPLNTGGRYQAGTWTPTLTTDAPAARSQHAGVWTGSELVVWGGLNAPTGTYFQTGGKYDPATDTWTETSVVNAPSARAGATAVWADDISRMIVWGGYAASGTLSNGSPQYVLPDTGAKFDPVSNSWAAIATTGAPAARRYHTAVWAPEIGKMIVWGGETIAYDTAGNKLTSSLATGAKYDTGGDAWAATATTGAPLARSRHSAIWTGDRMIVWGGNSTFSSAGFLNSGGRYNPSGDTWSPTATAGAPSTRQDQTAVWSGSEMLVWGGFGNGFYVKPDGFEETCICSLGDGAKYNPAGDTWTSINATGAPGRRYGHTALWTGIEMLVWGGTGGGSSLPTSTYGPYHDDGGRYDPLSDSWTSTSVLGAATPRAGQVAGYTGNQLLVWGGNNGSELDSGGRYTALSGALATYYLDGDGDGTGGTSGTIQSYTPVAGYASNAADCNDADLSAWSTPSEVRDVAFTDAAGLVWRAPSAPGASEVLYDAIRSGTAADFVAGATCLATGSMTPAAGDPEVPAPGGVFFYLVRAQNACPNGLGVGSLGTDSSGRPRTARTCP